MIISCSPSHKQKYSLLDIFQLLKNVKAIFIAPRMLITGGSPDFTAYHNLLNPALEDEQREEFFKKNLANGTGTLSSVLNPEKAVSEKCGGKLHI